LVVEVAVDGVVARRQLDTRDVADARDASVGPRLDDDVLELLGLAQPAEGRHGELERVPGGHGLLPDGPRSHLHGLLAQGLSDVAARDAPAREPARIEPNAHAVLAEPEEVDVADAL